MAMAMVMMGCTLHPKAIILLNNITADGNKNHGAEIRNTASSSGATVTIDGSKFSNTAVNSFSNNADDGLMIFSDGTINLFEIVAGHGNGTGTADNGAEIDNSSGNGNVSITGYHNSFSNNAGPGLDIDSKGNLDLFFATIENNNQAGGSDGATFDSSSVSSKAANVYCSIFGNNSGDGLDAWNFRGSLDFHGMDSFTDYRYNGTAGFADYDCTVPVYGCTDPTALNYNPEANTDDESCEYPTSSGGGGGGERNTGTPRKHFLHPGDGRTVSPAQLRYPNDEVGDGKWRFCNLCRPVRV